MDRRKIDKLEAEIQIENAIQRSKKRWEKNKDAMSSLEGQWETD